MIQLFSLRNIPLYYLHGKGLRKASINAIMSMNYYKRNGIHHDMQNVIDLKLSAIPPIARDKEDHYIIKYGFFEDSKTGNFDLDNIGWIIKTTNDCIAKKLKTNDSYHTFIKYEVGFYGTSDQEHLDVQVFKTKAIVAPMSKEKRMKEIMLAEGIDADKIKTILELMNDKDLI